MGIDDRIENQAEDMGGKMKEAAGKVTGTDCKTTGMAIRKMISNTSITSTNGTTLMSDIVSISSPSPGPTLTAM